MRRDFDQSVSQEDALKQIPKVHTGNKHQRRPGPGKIRKKQPNPRVQAKEKKRKARVHAY